MHNANEQSQDHRLESNNIDGWLAGKELYVLFSLLCLIGAFVFKDFFLFKKLYLFKDIGSDTVNHVWPRSIHLSQYLRSEGLPQWSFNQGLGQNTFGLILWDNFFGLLLLWPGPMMAYGFFFVEFGKIILTGIFFFLYLRLLPRSRFTSIVGALMLSYSGYLVLCSSWPSISTEVPCAAFLLYAFERFFTRKSWSLFPIAIALFSIYQPFWLYIYGIFLIVYVLFRFFSARHNHHLHPRLLPLFGKLAALSLLGLAIGAVFMFSSVLRMLESPRGSPAVSYSHALFFKPIFQFAPFMHNVTAILRSFSNDMLGNGGSFRGWNNYFEAPIFYCGLANLLLLPQMFGFLSRRKKYLYGIVVFVWVLPVIFPWFRYLFWGFIGNYYRSFSFFVTFYLLFLGLNGLNSIERRSKINGTVLVVTLAVLLVALYFPYFRTHNPVDVELRNCVALFLILYARLIYFMTHTKNKRGAYFFFLALLVIELTFFSSTTVNSRPVLSSEELQEKVGYNDYTVDALSYLKSIDNSFFRVSKYYDSGPAIHASLNDGMAQGYRGLTSYDSFNQGYYVKFMTALGVMNMSDEINFPRWAFGLEARPFLQILLSAKYALSKMSYADIFMNGGRLINSFGDVAVYQNEFFLPFGFTYQGYLSFDDFNKMSASQRDVALLQTCVINEKDGRAFEGLRLFEINDVKNSTAPAEVRAYVENLGSEALLIDQQSQNHIHGTITLQKRKILFLSIPYDRGWMVRVDGEKIKPYIVNVGFMGFPLGQGKHTVELCYRSPLLVEGAVISLIGIFAYLMFVLRGMIKSCGLGFKKE